MSKKEYKYLYGPVPSRRLGRSLGVDIVPHKVCSYDCVYCQLGRTTELTCRPRPLVNRQDVIAELKSWLSSSDAADYITFAGSGEPTLNTELAGMINETLCITDIPVAVITNGSLLSNADVRRAVMEVDVLLPSLDAGTEETFHRINRPAEGIPYGVMVDGLIHTRQEFEGKFHLEVMLVRGLNDSESELSALAEMIQRIGPDKIQVNTVERPSRSGEVSAVSQETLDRAAGMFGPSSEVVTSREICDNVWDAAESSAELVLSLLRRRPCTLDDIAEAARIHVHEAAKFLRHLMSDGLVTAKGKSTDPYYCVTDDQGGKGVQR